MADISASIKCKFTRVTDSSDFQFWRIRLQTPHFLGVKTQRLQSILNVES